MLQYNFIPPKVRAEKKIQFSELKRLTTVTYITPTRYQRYKMQKLWLACCKIHILY